MKERMTAIRLSVLCITLLLPGMVAGQQATVPRKGADSLVSAAKASAMLRQRDSLAHVYRLLRLSLPSCITQDPRLLSYTGNSAKGALYQQLLASAGLNQHMLPNILSYHTLQGFGLAAKLPNGFEPAAALTGQYQNLLSGTKNIFSLPSTLSTFSSLGTSLTGTPAGWKSLTMLPATPAFLHQGLQLPSTNLFSGQLTGLQGKLTNQVAQTFMLRSLLAQQISSRYASMDDAIGKNFKRVTTPSYSANLTLENDLQYNPVSIIPRGSKFQEVVGVRGTVTLMGVPLALNLSNNQAAFNGQNPLGTGLFKFGFSPASFTGLLKNQLQQYSDLKTSVFHGFNFTDYVKQTITDQMHSMETSAAALKQSPLYNMIHNPDALQQLMKMSDAEVEQKLHALAAEEKTVTSSGAAPGQAMTDAEKELNSLRADSLAHIIATIKRQLMAKGLDPSKMVLFENYLSGKTSSAFNSSEAASTLTQKQPGNGLQSLFSNVKDMHVGSFGTTLPGADPGDQSKLVHGASLTMKMGLYPISFGFGTLNDVNSLKDASYQSSVYNFPKGITFIGADMPHSSLGTLKVSVVGAFSGPSAFLPTGGPGLPSNAVDLTLAKTMNLDKLGRVELDVSKSSTLFDNSYQSADAILLTKSGANANLANNLFSSFSFGFRHNLNLKALDASDNVYFSYSGFGFENPANNGYTGGTMKFGGDLKKNFKKNKLLFDLRTDYSNTPLSYTNDDKWKSYQVQMTGTYKLTKTLNFSLKYLLNGTEKKTDSAANSVYSAQKLELDANDTYKIGDELTTIRVAVAGQTFRNSYLSAAGSDLLSLNYTQSLVFRTSAATFTCFYNKELTPGALLGDMLTSDLAYQYKISKELQLTSGATYLYNARVADQIGVKQGLQVLASKHFEAGASVDLMKNLITPEYADLFPSVRGEINLKYLFKVN